jgi:hypothetical protein
MLSGPGGAPSRCFSALRVNKTAHTYIRSDSRTGVLHGGSTRGFYTGVLHGGFFTVVPTEVLRGFSTSVPAGIRSRGRFVTTAPEVRGARTAAATRCCCNRPFSGDQRGAGDGHAGDPCRLDVRTALTERGGVEIVIGASVPRSPPRPCRSCSNRSSAPRTLDKEPDWGWRFSYGIVQEHDGRLHGINREDGGAVFTITLPAGSSEAVE